MKSSKETFKKSPVVIIRKKAGTKNALSSPAQPPPRTRAATQTAAPAIAKSQHPAPQPSPTTAAVHLEPGPSKKRQEQQARRALLDTLRTLWPQAFPRDYHHVRPLALGISRDIAARLPEQPLQRISTTIGLFQMLTGPAYYQAILQGGPRYDLDGNPRGEVTPKEQEQAKGELAAFFARRKQRITAKPKSAENSAG